MTEDDSDDYADIRRKAFVNSFLVLSAAVVQDGEAVRDDGQRPGPGWDAHGWCAKRLTVLKDGKPTQIVLHKRR